jgi:hypothetical protein
MRLWAKKGNHQEWAEAAIRKNAVEHGGRVVGNPTCMVRTFDDGEHTVLGAEGGWWQEFMSVHGKDWRGPVNDEDGSVEDLLSDCL